MLTEKVIEKIKVTKSVTVLYGFQSPERRCKAMDVGRMD